MAKKQSKKQEEDMKALSEENNKISWFCIGAQYNDLEPGWYKITGTYDIDNNCSIDIKKRKTKKNIRISYKQYIAIINKFTKENMHLTTKK